MPRFSEQGLQLTVLTSSTAILLHPGGQTLTIRFKGENENGEATEDIQVYSSLRLKMSSFFFFFFFQARMVTKNHK